MPILDRSWLRIGKTLVDLLIVAGALLLLLEGGFGAFGSPWTLRRALLLACAALDLFFTLEFALKLGSAYYAGRLSDYLAEGDGWLEGLSSLPLLALLSGAQVFAALGPGGGTIALSEAGGRALPFLGQGLSALALLRLLRLLRLIGPARGYWRGGIRRKALLAAFSAFLALALALNFADSAGLWPELRAALAEKRLSSFAALERAPDTDGAEEVSSLDSELLLVRIDGRTLYTRHSAMLYPKLYGPEDIGLLGRGGIEAFFSLAAENRARAAASLVASLAILAVFAALLFCFEASD